MVWSKKVRLIVITICFYAIGILEARPLNILFVVAYFPAPSQTYILNLMTGLIDKGHKVSIFALRKNDVYEKLDPIIEKYHLLDHVIYESFPDPLPECDIVFCQSATLGKNIIDNKSLTKWLESKKLIVCLRGADITQNNVQNNPTMYQRLFERCDLFLPVCDYFKTLVVKLGCDPDKVIVHHSAIDCKKFFFKTRKKIKRKREIIQLISVCRLVKKKGLEHALEAVAQLVKMYKNIHFTIVGSGHLQRRLHKLTHKLKISNKVTFFGWATHDQIITLFDKSHIFLSPSVTADSGEQEGIANALKEAMAMGLIAVATNHAGTPELVENNVSGFLVAEGDSAALARKIKYVLKNSKQWKSIGMAARKKVEDEFEINKSIVQLEELFFTLLAV
jgi:colanic acid/amylovoran biosynthesis glycosyltransferase